MPDRESVLDAHKKNRGKIEIVGMVELATKEELATYYTPGVAYACLAIKDDKSLAYDYTLKGRTVAIVTDGTRVLGLGNIGPEAGMPVMEGKALLMKKYGGFDAIPICLRTTDESQIVDIVKAIAPGFGAVNIEDIESPKCFMIVERLKKELEIPVFHDDRQGTGAVALAGLFNAVKLAGKRIEDCRIVMNGAGAAGVGIVELLNYAGARHICVLDTDGIIYKGRLENMNYMKEIIADTTNRELMKGNLDDAVKGADILIGTSKKDAFNADMIKKMAEKPIVFALANPDPEIDYKDALDAGAFIAATGRSDRPNQVNNLYAFPGVLRGVLESRAGSIDNSMLLAASKAIAKSVGKRLARDFIVPDITDGKSAVKLAAAVASDVAKAAAKQGLAKIAVDGKAIGDNVKVSLKRYSKIEKFISRQK
jgi:malate dehydrogenase (oxaloacetate-decarboxylating)